MITSHFIPPHSPDALAIAHTLLAIAADPAGCKARLEELTRAKSDLQDTIKKSEDERTRLTSAQAREADLKQREQALAEQASAQERTATQLANARAAQQDRESKLQADAAALQQKIKEHEGVVSAHVRRVQQAKAALG